MAAQSEARRAASTKPACQSQGLAVAGVESPSHAWGGQRWDWGGRWQRSRLGRTAAARATGDWGDERARAVVATGNWGRGGPENFRCDRSAPCRPPTTGASSPRGPRGGSFEHRPTRGSFERVAVHTEHGALSSSSRLFQVLRFSFFFYFFFLSFLFSFLFIFVFFLTDFFIF